MVALVLRSQHGDGGSATAASRGTAVLPPSAERCYVLEIALVKEVPLITVVAGNDCTTILIIIIVVITIIIIFITIIIFIVSVTISIII